MLGDTPEYWCGLWDDKERAVMCACGAYETKDLKRLRDWLTKAIEWVEDGK
jgi:hypothetical protein